MQRISLITATALLLTALVCVGVRVHDKIEASRLQAYEQARAERDRQRDADEHLLVFGVRALREREQNEKELADAIEQNYRDAVEANGSVGYGVTK